MPLLSFDHVNIRTANLPQMINWYRQVLGLVEGDRPAFDIPGAWMYLGDEAIVHLVGVAETPANQQPALEHFAIRASGMAAFIENLKTHDVAFSLAPVPGYPVVQVNIHDCDGNHIHVDFPADEAAALGA